MNEPRIPVKSPENRELRPEDWDRYFTALGRFMHMFARAETGTASSLLLLTHSLTKNSDFATLKALIAGQRMAPTCQHLKRILRVKGASPHITRAVDEVLKQLSEIQMLRDRLAHYGGYPDLSIEGDWYNTSNMSGARETGTAELLSFSRETLIRAADDLHDIPEKLGSLLSRDWRGWPQPIELPPWRYKPSRLIRMNRKPKRTSPKQKRPPQS